MRGIYCSGLMALFFFVVAVASPAQCRATLPEIGSTNATAAVSSTALGSKDCDITFCTKT
ncbi:hypothetical protein EJB05_46549 [Eragrostis curvula]|uniref:Uncharacterized protein n=1 Tax=Eragrostis curvula TaxID=38414 RepID=A0A5J9TNC4_9POAL|nr:hypothetical protein EJB05_46549 [Eragrostis curvula]